MHSPAALVQQFRWSDTQVRNHINEDYNIRLWGFKSLFEIQFGLFLWPHPY